MTGCWHTMADHTLYCHIIWWPHPLLSHDLVTTPSIVTWSNDHTLYCHMIWQPHPLLSHDLMTTPSIVTWSDDHTLYCHMIWWPHPYCHMIWWPQPLLSHDLMTTSLLSHDWFLTYHGFPIVCNNHIVEPYLSRHSPGRKWGMVGGE